MTTTSTETTTVADEIAAMRRIVAALDKLDPNAQRRVVGWLNDRYFPARTIHVNPLPMDPAMRAKLKQAVDELGGPDAIA